MTGARTISVASVLGGVTLAAWIVLVGHMRGMDMGPGTDLGGLGWFLLLWVTMTTAMMLPSVAPMALLFARVSQGRVPIWVFLSDYLAAWSGFGLLAYAVFRLVRFLDPAFLGWQRAGPWIAGGAVTAAGLYQLTPLKRACLRHCRSPLHFVLGGWRTGRRGALELGAQHGAYCVGCCWGLMVVLFALGVMSLFWMAVVAAVIYAEKVTPFGARISRPLSVILVALGIWVAVAPSSVPGLTQPATDPGARTRTPA